MRKLIGLILCLGMLAIGTTALPGFSYARDDNHDYKWEAIDKTASEEVGGSVKIITEKMVVDHGYIIRTIVMTNSGCSVTQTFVVTNH